MLQFGDVLGIFCSLLLLRRAFIRKFTIRESKYYSSRVIC